MTDDLMAGLAIRRLAERYAVSVDRRDGDAFASVFTENGVIESPRGRVVGRDAIRGIANTMSQFYERTFHAVLTQVADVSGQKAKAETYCIARHFNTDDAGAYSCYEMTIRYQDDCVRDNGVWLFSQRILVVDATRNFPVNKTPVPITRRT